MLFFQEYYSIICGIKEERNETFVQIYSRGKSTGKSTSAVKKQFGKDFTYHQVLSELKTEFGKVDTVVPLVLVDMHNKEIVDKTNFKISSYVRQCKYVGSTRIYLGLKHTETLRDDLDLETVKDEGIPDELQQDEKREIPVTDTEEPNHTAEPTDEEIPHTFQPPEKREIPVTETGNVSVTHSDSAEPIETLDPSIHQELNVCITEDDAIKFLQAEKREEEERGLNLDPGELAEVDSSRFCPVHASQPSLYLFQEHKGKIYEKVSSGYGEFLLVPHDEMDEFGVFSQIFNGSSIFLVNPAILYYISNVYVSSNPVKVNEISSQVWELPKDVADGYQKWKVDVMEAVTDD